MEGQAATPGWGREDRKTAGQASTGPGKQGSPPSPQTKPEKVRGGELSTRPWEEWLVNICS